MRGSTLAFAALLLAATFMLLHPLQYGGGGGTAKTSPGIDMILLAGSWLAPALWRKERQARPT